MLSEIAIKNLAIIDDIRIRLESGLNILTGETGAGKSIIINAINIILGDRANSRVIRTGENFAEIEAEFIINNDKLTKKVLDANGFNSKDGLIVRRIISSNNRHKIYINGRLSTSQTLKEITKGLASVSGQHEHQSLLDEKNYIFLLDGFAGLNSKRKKLSDFYHEILSFEEKIKDLKSEKSEFEKNAELLDFQKKEIEEAFLMDPEEDSLLANELKIMRNAKKLKEISEKSSSLLYSGNNSVSETLALIKKDLSTASAIDENFFSFMSQLESVYEEISDMGRSILEYTDRLETDENTILIKEERLELINRLKHKYGGNISAILDHYSKISDITSDMGELDIFISSMEEDLNEKRSVYFSFAEKLSLKRKKAAKVLETEISSSIKELDMPYARFYVKIDSDSGRLSESGIDRVMFFISPNPGEEPKPIMDTASGGELSRLILAIKSSTAESDNVSTIIFDEADAGIGGQAAEKTGEKIKKISKNTQVICITHLPQLAKFADHHYYIEKNVENNRTRTSIKYLSAEERIQEIARMISGDNFTETALTNARELIEQAADIGC